MMRDFTLLEQVVKRAPLGLRFRDLAYGVNVTDGMHVTARPFGEHKPILQAYRSPVSGIYGFYSLPGLKAYEDNEKPASDWCGPGSPPNWVITAEDRFERFLPQVLPMCLPREQLMVVELYSSPARPSTAGYATIRGEIWDKTVEQPARWALISAANGLGGEYAGVSDGRGMFVLYLPYPKPVGNVPLNQQQWPLTFRVFYQPGAQKWAGQAAPEPNPGETAEAARRRTPPDSDSLIQQAAAGIFDTPAGVGGVVVRPLQYRFDLVLATTGQSRLWVVPI